jgi:hypothetical protein
MAIGDAVAVTLGTAQTDRQPSSGVEEQITAIIHNGNTDASAMYNGSVAMQILAGGVNTHTASAVGTTASNRQTYNMALMSTNTTYIRKVGTTDAIYFGGVQTNA